MSTDKRVIEEFPNVFHAASKFGVPYETLSFNSLYLRLGPLVDVYLRCIPWGPGCLGQLVMRFERACDFST